MKRAYPVAMDRPVTVACVQAEPAILDRERTLDRLEELAAEAAGNGAELVVFPETFVPVYPSSRWAKAFAGWQDDGAKATFARTALYESGVEIYIASTADDSDAWQATLVHIARESRAYVVAPCHFQRASSYPSDFALASELAGDDLLGHGGSAILAPNGSYLAGPLHAEEGILYAELDPSLLLAERQRFDAVGHYSRPDVLRLEVSPSARARDATPNTRPSVQSARS